VTGLECPACDGLRRRRSFTELLCPTCWRKVPGDLRSEVWRAWRNFQDGEVTSDELRAVQAAAIEAVKR
jgi:hypothetical protein